MKNKKKRRSSKGKLKPCGKLKLKDVFNLTKKQAREFRKAALEEEEQKKMDFQVGGVMDLGFKIGEAGMSLKSVKKLLLPAR